MAKNFKTRQKWTQISKMDINYETDKKHLKRGQKCGKWLKFKK